MRVSECVGCQDFPCTDVRHDCYVVPAIDIRPSEISIVMISEAAPPNPADYYYYLACPSARPKRQAEEGL